MSSRSRSVASATVTSGAARSSSTEPRPKKTKLTIDTTGLMDPPEHVPKSASISSPVPILKKAPILKELDIRQHMNIIPANYCRNVINKFAKDLKLNPKNKKKLLDIYCDTGNTLVNLMQPKWRKNFSTVVGAESSLAAIDLAKKHNRSDIEFRYIDLSERVMDWREKYDLITSFGNFHFLSNQRLAFEHLYNLLEPGGTVLISMLASSPLYRIFNGLTRTTCHPSTFLQPISATETYYQNHPCPVADVSTILKEVGFDKCDVRLCEEEFKYNTYNDFKDKVKSLNKWRYNIHPYGEELFYWQAFLELRDERHFGLESLDGGPLEWIITIPVKMLYIIARKPFSSEMDFAEKKDEEKAKPIEHDEIIEETKKEEDKEENQFEEYPYV